MSASMKVFYFSMKTKCFCSMLQHLCCPCVVHCNVMAASTLSAQKFVVEMDEKGEIEYSAKGFLKKHSGQFSQKRVNLPEQLENACKIVAANTPDCILQIAEKLSGFRPKRALPAEPFHTTGFCCIVDMPLKEFLLRQVGLYKQCKHTVQVLQADPRLGQCCICKSCAQAHRKEHGGSSLQREAASLARYLWSRHAPVTEEELQQKAEKAEQQVEEEDGIDVTQLDETETQDVLSLRKGKILNILRSNVYHWEPVTYNMHKGMLYMLSRLAVDYAVLHKIFAEIKYREVSFRPTSLLDFGSGLGSVCWAANTIWPDTVSEHYCIDHSADMNSLARLLVQNGDESKIETCFKGMFFRQMTPLSDKEKYNLVVSAFTLIELPSKEERCDLIKLLWRKTLGFLVLVENGTKAGFDLIAEARDTVLKLIDKRGELRGHVFAPCPHNKVCPRQVKCDKTPCNFEAYYRPISLMKKNAEVHSDSFRYSYVVLRKGEITMNQPWPRFVRPPLIRNRHVHCDVCAPSGSLERYTFTFKKNRQLYKCVKRSHWGDLLPVKVVSRETAATGGTQQSRDGDADLPSLDIPSENNLHEDNIKTESCVHTGSNVTLSVTQAGDNMEVKR